MRAVNGEKRRGERGIDSVSAPIGHHSLTPLSLPSLPYGRDRHLWGRERPREGSGGHRPRPVCYFKIVIRPPSPPSSVLAVNTPLDRHRPVAVVSGNIFPLARCGSWFGFFSSNPIQGRAKERELRLVREVPSRLIGYALAALC